MLNENSIPDGCVPVGDPRLNWFIRVRDAIPYTPMRDVQASPELPAALADARERAQKQREKEYQIIETEIWGQACLPTM